VNAQEQQSPSQGVNVAGIIRTVNTAQAEWLAGHGSYASLHDLVRDKSWQKGQITLEEVDASSAKLGDYQLTVIVSPDGHRYSASVLRPTGCGVAMFSSESGVIYQATALGCDSAH
jgi:hypothetical protein